MFDDSADRIRRVIGMTGLPLKTFAEKNEISQNSIQFWLRDNHVIKPKLAKSLSEMVAKSGVRASILWLMHGLGETPQLIPHIDATPEELATVPQKIKSHDQLKQEIVQFVEQVRDAITLDIKDETMLPFYRVHDFVGGTLIAKDQYMHVVQHHCIVKLVGQPNWLCRKLVYSDYRYFLSATNLAATETLALIAQPEIEFIAPVTRVWHAI